jgi:hypothetical protein
VNKTSGGGAKTQRLQNKLCRNAFAGGAGEEAHCTPSPTAGNLRPPSLQSHYYALHAQSHRVAAAITSCDCKLTHPPPPPHLNNFTNPKSSAVASSERLLLTAHAFTSVPSLPPGHIPAHFNVT